jgi:DNA-binding transcriptional LysR family regulator
LHITDFGKEIAQLSEKVVSGMDAINYKTEAYQGIMTGRLKVSSASTGKYVIPYFLSGFLEKYSGIDLLLDVTNKSRVVESLKGNEIDFALVSVLPDTLDVEEEILIENKLYLVGNQPHKQENKALIYREEGSATRSVMEKYFTKHSRKERKRMELTSNEAVKQATLAGLGYSIIPLIGIQNELLKKQLYILHSKGLPIKTEWRLIWLKNKQLSPVAEAYLQFVRENKAAILKADFEWYVQHE